MSVAADLRKSKRTTIRILATYFGEWPVWFPAFLLSCARNETIEWLFFTDCDIPEVPYQNITFESLDISQLNDLASQKLGIPVRKKTYSQVDLQPAFGVIFDEYVRDYDFWGHCDIDLIWGDIRSFISEEILQSYDIVSCRKDFLAGHLTLWRNSLETNTLFRSVPSYDMLFSSDECFSFDEAVISTYLRTRIETGKCHVRVYWPEEQVTWFRGFCTSRGWQWALTPTGWCWDQGKIFDVQGREHVYLHFQHWKNSVKSIDFQIGDRPAKFEFTQDGIRAVRPSSVERFSERFGSLRRKSLRGLFVYWPRKLLQIMKRAEVIRDIFWSGRMVVNSISVDDVQYERSTQNLSLKRLDLQIKKEEHGFLQSYSAALLLADKCQARFYRDSRDKLFVEAANLVVAIKGYGEIAALEELLVKGIFDVQLPHRAVVLDIGMYAGLAAMFFALRPGVIVVGYEPCRHIYEQALQNFALNPAVSAKIRVINAGIGEANYETIAGYLPKPKSQPSILAPSNLEFEMRSNFEYEEIEIRDVAQIIDALAAEYPQREIVIKIDLEHPEYYIDGVTDLRIINRLYETDKLNNIHTVVVKWRGPKSASNTALILDQLNDVGFDVNTLTAEGNRQGLIYAVRTATQVASNHPEIILK